MSGVDKAVTSKWKRADARDEVEAKKARREESRLLEQNFDEEINLEDTVSFGEDVPETENPCDEDFYGGLASPKKIARN